MKIKTYKLEHNFSSVDFSNETEVWFGDPCYVVPGWDDDYDLWEKLCDKMFQQVTVQNPETGEVHTCHEPSFDERNNIRVVEIDDVQFDEPVRFYMWSTSYGDGCYPLVKDGDGVISKLGVDAGCLSVVPMSLIKKWNKEEDARELGYVTDDFRKARLEVENGDMFWGDYSLHTGGEDVEEEDPWMECDEESYIN